MAHLTAKKGDTIPLEVAMNRSAPGELPHSAPVVTPVDLTGSVEIWFTAKRSFTDLDDDAVIRLGTLNTGLSGITVTDAANGRARVIIPAAATAGLEPGTVFLVYDVQLLELDGTLTTVDSGRLALVDQVTRDS
jgi:hypothetical protein